MVNEGQFVACNDLGVGKVRAVRGKILEVEYFDSVGRQVVHTLALETVSKASLPAHTRCFWLNNGHWHVGRIKEELLDAYRVVSHQLIRDVPKDELFVRWAKPLEDPTDVLVARACESPRFHASRRTYVESLVRQRAASRGLAGVLSSRVELHQHQVEIARRVLEDAVPRYLLADEVGLGKTIETGFILRQFFLDNPTARALVVVPPFLVDQWREEMMTKFSLGDFHGVTLQVLSYLDDEHWSAAGNPDIMIIDEAHNIAECAHSSERRVRRRYDRAVELAAKSPRVLLLSATPLLHNEETFLAMLRILDQESYRLDAIDEFRKLIADRAEVGRIMLSFTEDAPHFLLGDYTETLRRLFPGDQRLSRLLGEFDESLAREDVANEESVEDSDESETPDDTEIARCIRAIRVHVSETHRIYRRLLRTRRTSALEATFPVRGRSKPEVLVVEDMNRRFADSWLERWRDASLLAAALISDPEERHAYEQMLGSVFQIFLERTISSIAAISVAVTCRRRASKRASATSDLSSSEVARLAGAPRFEGEDELLDELLDRNVVPHEARAEAIAQFVTSLPGRDKTIVFTSFRATAEAVHARLRAILGPKGVASHFTGADPMHTEVELTAFRSSDSCRVLVCDRSGEEGRNFQFAQHLVHYDLPWSPNRLEQRLGRMDRFGVGRTVRSVVFMDAHKSQSVHDQWYESLASSFKIFDRSIAAYQFAVDRLMSEIETAVFMRGADALQSCASLITTRLEEDGKAIAEQDVLDTIEAVDRNDAFFEELTEMDEDHDGLRDGFEVWAVRGTAVNGADLGFKCYVDPLNSRIFTLGAKHDTRLPRDWLIRLLGEQPKQRGTFSRNVANRNHDARLFRIGMPLYDGIRDFSEWDDRGRAFALWRYRSTWAERETEWAFRFDYVVEADVTPACSALRETTPGVRQALQRRLDGLLPPRMRTIWIDALGEPITDPQRLDELEAPYDQDKGDVNIRSDRFAPVDAHLGQARWKSLCVDARRDSEKALRSTTEFEGYVRGHLATARRILHGRLEILRSRAEKSAVTRIALAEIAREERLVEGFLAGIAKPRVRLESIGFVMLAGTPIDG